MSKRSELASVVVSLLGRDVDSLEGYLLANSGLPGPRSNLELAEAFADAVSAEGGVAPHWPLLERWAGIPAADADTNDPKVYLAFCALQAMGGLLSRRAASRAAAHSLDAPDGGGRLTLARARGRGHRAAADRRARF